MARGDRGGPGRRSRVTHRDRTGSTEQPPRCAPHRGAVTQRTRLLRRLLAAGLAAGLGGVGLATAAQATPTTVDTGHRTPVHVDEVSPAALPASLGTGGTRGTRPVTVTL